MSTCNDYCIILAGGVGRRLWPCSRRNKPKQFIDFFGSGRTLLQQTFDRFSRIIPADHIVISTFKDYLPLVEEQLPEIPIANILAEPVQHSTAPAVAWASCHISMLDPEANIVVSPSDQYIIGEEHFAEQIRKGLSFVRTHEDFLAIGVKPSVPNTAYGYIQMGANGVAEHMYRVKSFSEKPAQEYARLFVESGEFLWNTGLFLWHAPTMLKMIKTHTVGLVESFSRSDRNISTSDEVEAIKKYYPASLHRSLDLVILEKCQNVYVQQADFGWADVGCWPEIYEVSEKDADGNVVLSSPNTKVMLSACRNNLVRLPDGMGAVIKGLDGYLVAQKNNMLVICPNNDPALARRLVNEVQVQLGEEFV